MSSNPSPSTEPIAPVERRIKPWESLAFPDYRLLWAASLVGTVGLQMRQFANVWQVYEITGSPLQLGLTGLFQALPLFTLGLFAGTIADMVDRRKLLIWTQAVNLLLALALGVLTFSGRIEVWHIFLMTSLTAAVNIFGQPARIALISATVPKTHLMNAITLNQVIQQGAMLGGPSLAGIVVAYAGPSSAYFVNATLFVPAIIMLVMMRTRPVVEGERRRFRLSSTLEGLKFVWVTPILVGLILLDTIATLFGSYRAVMPIINKDILHGGPATLGLLMSAPAFGAVAGTLSILGLGNVARKGMLALVSTALYGAGLAVFGLSVWLPLSLVAAGSLGFFDSMGVSARQTTAQMLTPEHLRGRTTSIQQVFAQGSPSMGYLLAGFIASIVGAPQTMLIGCAVVISIVILLTLLNRDMRDYRA